MAGLVALEVATDEVEGAQRVLAGGNLAGEHGARAPRLLGVRLGSASALDTERRLARVDQAVEGLDQRLEVDATVGADAVRDQRLDGQAVLARVAQRREDRRVLGERAR